MEYTLILNILTKFYLLGIRRKNSSNWREREKEKEKGRTYMVLYKNKM